MSQSQLMLEVLSGPLDGTLITLNADAEWSQAGDGRLAFPWDEELGKPQARFTVDEGGWSLEGLQSPHGTYRLNQEKPERVKDKIQLTIGDLLKASQTWLMVRE